MDESARQNSRRLTDNETTSPGVAERSPFFVAYLELDRHVSKSVHLRSDLVAMLDERDPDRADCVQLINHLFAAWEVIERAKARMADVKQPHEQASYTQIDIMLREQGTITVNVIAEASRYIFDEHLLARAEQLRVAIHERYTTSSVLGREPGPDAGGQ